MPEFRHAAGGKIEQKMPHGWCPVYVTGKVDKPGGGTKPKLVALADGVGSGEQKATYKLATAADIKAHFDGVIAGGSKESEAAKPPKAEHAKPVELKAEAKKEESAKK